MINDPINSFIKSSYPTGSRYICNPPVMDTDNDVIVLAEPGYESVFEANGFNYQSSEIEYDNQGMFVSWRRGEDNYIVTQDLDFYSKFVKATELAKNLNLLNREHRVMLFEAILYDN